MPTINNFKQFSVTAKMTKKSLVAVAVIFLAACGPSTTTSEVETPTSQTNPQQTTIIAAIPDIKDISEIQFVEPTDETAPSGVVDAVNNSTELEHTLTKSSEPITVAGWAILPSENQPADKVIITTGDNNNIVAVAPVDQARPDVAQAFNNPAVETSGWIANIDPSLLPSETVTLKAWAYNSDTKEASLLGGVHQVTIE